MHLIQNRLNVMLSFHHKLISFCKILLLDTSTAAVAADAGVKKASSNHAVQSLIALVACFVTQLLISNLILIASY